MPAPDTLLLAEIAPPPFTPAPSGLLSVAVVETVSDPHILGGAQWESVSCDNLGVVTVDPCVLDATPDPLVATFCNEATSVLPPFAVVLREEAPLPGRTRDDRASRLRDRFTAFEETAVTAEVISGSVVDPLLAGWSLANAVPTGGAPADALAALGAVEDALAAVYGGIGNIWMAPSGVNAASDALVSSGGRLTTLSGNRVIVTAAAAGSVYGTGAVKVLRGPTELADDPRPAVNTGSLLLWRTYLVGWDCAAFISTYDES